MLARRPAASMAPRQAAWPRAIGAITRWRDAARVGLDGAFRIARRSEAKARDAKDAAGEKAEAARGKLAAAAHVPADVTREVRLELDAWGRGVAKRLALALAVGALGLVALIVLTVGAVVLLNRLLGDPYGTLAVGLLHVAAAFVGVGLMARATRGAEHEAERHHAHAAAAVTLDPPPEVVRERTASAKKS